MHIDVLDILGNDLTVVNAARVSFDKWKDDLDEKDEKLIRYLLEHDHWTPFAHPQMTLRISAPIFVAREWFRHTIGVARNEVSRRYVTTEPEFWHPEYFRIKAENVKQGSINIPHEESNEFINEYDDLIDACANFYNKLIEKNVAPEQARAILPQAMYTTWIETGSLYYFLRLISLRTTSDAQIEIQLLATYLEDIVETAFPICYEAFTLKKLKN